MGCLTLPLRIAGVVALLLVLGAAWIFRSDIESMARRELGMPAKPAPGGRAVAGADGTGKARIDSVLDAKADSTVLSEDEVATLITAQLRGLSRRGFDSLVVVLDNRSVELQLWIPVSALPGGVRSLVGGVLRPSESIQLDGTVGVRYVGLGEWVLSGAKIRGIPIPKQLVERMATDYLPTGAAELTFPLPREITGLRAVKRGLVLYGGG